MGTSDAGLPGPSKFLMELLRVWQLSERDGMVLLGCNGTDQRRLQEELALPTGRWPRDRKERVAHLIEMRATLDALLHDLDAENEWLREPRTELDSRSPLDLMRSGSMEELIAAKYFVRAVAGR